MSSLNSRLTLPVSLALGAVAALGLLSSPRPATGYPQFLIKAKKMSLTPPPKDCTYCHTSPQGMQGWNERGKWLVAQKEKRQADQVDVSWLKEYKPVKKKGS